MADEAPSEEVKNLQLDDVTGEMVSKTELKKRKKAREQAEKKAAKASAAPPKPAAKAKGPSAEDQEKDLDPRVREPFIDYD